MSKAVLVMDMPENCDQCCIRAGALAYCQAMKRSTSHHPSGKLMDERERPSWCPLVPLPEKLFPDQSEKGNGWVDGWNACINKMAGGKD